jgi:hypothetical protein
MSAAAADTAGVGFMAEKALDLVGNITEVIASVSTISQGIL